MALITIQRNKFTHNSVNITQMNEMNSENGLQFEEQTDLGSNEQNSVNECYFAVRGAAIILPHEECLHLYKSLSTNHTTQDIQKHLQSMFLLLRPEDTLKMAVKLESVHQKRTRYLIIVNVSQSREESCLLGIDYNNEATIGLVLPVWADTRITLDGDGGFSITSSGRHHIFKPVSVQAMWSALQALHRANSKSRENNYFEGGGTHSWIDYYLERINSDRSCLNEWHAMDDLVSKRPPSPDLRTKPSEQIAIEQRIRAKLKEVMMTVDLDAVTSKYIRTKLEKELEMDLSHFKSFIDEEMLTILGQLDEPSEIFDYLYLGSEWNASNYEELKGKGVGKILNVTREIDNFFPGMFDYYNIRVYDDDSTEMLKYWDKTFRYIRKAKDEGSKVLVHCKKGISRSASVVLAFVMKETGWGLDKSIEFVKNKRNCIRPNSGFLKQLEIYQGILDASKNRNNSLWRSKSETNLVSKDNCLNRKSQEEFSNGKNRTHKQSNIANDSNKENTNNANILLIPGSVERPKSWSPEDSTYNELFPQQFNSKNSGMKEMKSRRSFTGRQRFGTDPSCYYIVEAKKNSESKHIENCSLDMTSAVHSVHSLHSPRISIVKDRITDFETFPQLTSGINIESTKVSGNCGLVHILANQFETSNSKKSTQSIQKEVMADLSNIEHIQKIGLQSKPPIPKPQSTVDKMSFKSESLDNEKMCTKSHSLFDISKLPPNLRLNHKLNTIINDRISSDSNEHLVDINKYYVKEDSTEFVTKSDTKVVPEGKVVNTKRKIEENNLKRTNSYDSILADLSLSLFDKRSSESAIESISQSIKSKTHKRSTSLYSGTTKWIPLPALTTRSPPIRLSSSSSDQMEASAINSITNIVHSKSMPSVVEAVNEVLCSTRVMMNSLIESIPISKPKPLNDESISAKSKDNEKEIANSLVNSSLVEDKSLSTNKKQDLKTISQTKKIHFNLRLPDDILGKNGGNGGQFDAIANETLGVVRRLTKQLEAKAKGNSCIAIETCDTKEVTLSQLSQSTPSSPNFNRNTRPRSSTFNEFCNTEETPLIPALRKTSLEFPFKRSKSQTSYDNVIQSNRVLNLNNNMEISSSNRSKPSKKCCLPQLSTNVNINAMIIESQLSFKSGAELHKKQPQKKLQQGKSHPLTRLMPQNSKFKNSGSLLNTM